MHIENLNSAVDVNIVRGKRKSSRAAHTLTVSEDAILAHLGILIPHAFRIPIYLVNETLMDTITPPEKCVSEACLRDILVTYTRNEERDFGQRRSPERRRRGEGIEDWEPREREKSTVDIIFDRLDKCLTYTVEAMGVYVASPSLQLVRTIHRVTGKDISSETAIFICPERVVHFADSASVPHELAFRKVVYHELSHAYMDVGAYDSRNTWQRVLEESSANAITLLCFESDEDRANAIRLMQKQPVEYRGYPYICASLAGFDTHRLLDVLNKIPPDFLFRPYWHAPVDWLILLQEADLRYPNLLTLWINYKRYSYRENETILKTRALEILRMICGVK